MFAANTIALPVADSKSPLAPLFKTGLRLTVGALLRPRHQGAATVYRVESGWLSRTRLLPDGRAQIVELLLPGDMIGLEWLAGNEPWDSYEALSDARLGSCELRDFERAITESPNMALALTRAILVKQEELRSWITVLGQADARSRLAFLLVHVADRSVAVAGEYSVPLTQHRLGELLGLTSVHVNRTIRDLREAGFATMTRGRARLQDKAGLERIARGYRGDCPAMLAAETPGLRAAKS